jgi:hypothetical protein
MSAEADLAAVVPTSARGLRLALLATAVFLVFFQAQAVAPPAPLLAAEFAVAPSLAGLLVPESLAQAIRGFLHTIGVARGRPSDFWLNHWGGGRGGI